MTLPAIKHLAILASAALVASCANSGAIKTKEEIAIAADFKVIKPVKPQQKAMLEKLPVDKMSRVILGGKTFYVLPDREDGQAYIGGPKKYQSYQQLMQAKAVAVEANQGETRYESEKAAAANWGGWDGWDGAEGWSSEDGQTN